MSRLRYYIRTHRSRVALTALAAVAALGAGIGVGVLTDGPSSPTLSTASASAPTTVAPAPMTSPTSVASASAAGTKARRGVRGTITAISGQTWTLTTFAGKTVTVDITSATKFGPRAVPSAIVVGADVAVAGTRNGSTITATAVGLARPKTTSPTTSTNPSVPAG